MKGNVLMQASPPVRGIPEYAGDYHMKSKTLLSMGRFQKDFKNTGVAVLYSFIV